jgi:hypothetical protein
MSSPIMPIRDLRVPSKPMSPVPGDGHDVAAFVAALAASERTLNIEAARGGPPPEVLEQIGVAGRTGEALRERGQEVRFSFSEAGRVKVELHNDDGGGVRTLSLTEVFDLAAGKPLG